MRVTEYWNSLFRGAVGSPSLEIFKKHSDMPILSDQLLQPSFSRGVGSDDPFNIIYPMIL